MYKYIYLNNFRKKIIYIFLILPFFYTFLDFIYAQQIPSTELINNSTYYDNKMVTYEGEVIGDILKRDRYCWINVNDGNGSIGIWTEEYLIKDITYLGNYKAKGDWIRVSGVFHKNCFWHGGDLDIHANEVKIIKKGEILNIPFQLGKVRLIIILAIILFVEIIILLIKNLFKEKFKKE